MATIRSGRPTKLDDETMKRIVGAIQRGAPIRTAARLGGVDPATFYRWLQRGEKAKSGAFRDFRDEVLRAREEGLAVLLQRVHDASKHQIRRRRTIRRRDGTEEVVEEFDSDWRAAKFLLEVRDPKTFSVRRLIEAKLSGSVGVRSDDEEREAALELLKDPEVRAALERNRLRGLAPRGEVPDAGGNGDSPRSRSVVP